MSFSTLAKVVGYSAFISCWLMFMACAVVAGEQPGTTARTNTVTLNFRAAPLDLVLDYLSEAAGFIINKETEVNGTVDVWSKQPITASEAVSLLDSALKKNGLAVTSRGRILTVVKASEAKTSDLEVVTGSNPDEVEKSAQVVTQVIPVRHANAAQLVNNLQVLLPTSASLSVNESANSLVLVATKQDIRRMLRIIQSLDNALGSVSTIRVFPLRYADSRQLATVIQQLFAPQVTSQQGGGARPGGFAFGPGGPGGTGGGPGFGPLGGFPAAPGGAPGGGSGQPAAQGTSAGVGNPAGSRVVAVGDETSNCLIVSAASDYVKGIETLVAQLDVPATDATEMRVFKLANSDPAEMADELAMIFPDDTRSNTGTPSFGVGPFSRGFGNGPPGASGNTSSGQSDRGRKQVRVVAVPDARTSSIIVSAGSAVMPQVVKVVEQLDADHGRKEVVQVWELKNANPTEVNQVLRDLFNRQTTMRNSTANRQNEQDPLQTRQTQQLNQNQGGASMFGGRGQGFGASQAQGGATGP